MTKWHTILHIKDLEDATPESKMKRKIQQMFQTKRANIIFKNSILLHFLTVLAYINGKLSLYLYSLVILVPFSGTDLGAQTWLVMAGCSGHCRSLFAGAGSLSVHG